MAAVACAGCFDLPDFASDSLIDRPRILAVIADPPEVTPGASVSLSLLPAGGALESLDWKVCGSFTSFAMGGQYGENTGDQGCGGTSMTIGSGQGATFSSDVTQLLFSNDDVIRQALGSQLPEQLLNEIRTSVGVALTLEADAAIGGKHLRALKRVLLSERATPNHNPPPPVFALGELTIETAAPPSDFRCRPQLGGVAHVDPGTRVSLAPLLSNGSEDWLEMYQVLDARGMIGERLEQPSYSWFVSAGSLDHGDTREPDRSNTWQLPSSPGCEHLWLVVRDGHGGASACELAVEVGDAGCDE
jgi:hypothetical protein